LGSVLLQPLAKWYLAKDRSYSYQGLKLVIKPGVFHPGLFFSTTYLASFLKKLELANKTFLELGAGSGLLSLLAARQGASVTSLDISSSSIENTRLNASSNQLSITLILSDLMDEIPESTPFDFIFINPPYYPQDPVSEAEKAWYCGSSFQYFKKLFAQLVPRIPFSACYMILSEDCDIQAIRQIAQENGLDLFLIEKKRIWWEWNFIFRVERSK
jgi:release factor glutamine methyltransferase